MKTLRDILTETPALSDADAIAACAAQSPEPRDVDLDATRRAMMLRPEGGDSVADRLDDAIANAETQPDVRRAVRDGQRIILMPLVTLPAGSPEWQQLAASLMLLVGAGVIPSDRVGLLSSLLYVMPPVVTLDDVAEVRLAIAKDDRLNKYAVKATQDADAYRVAVNAATTIDALPPEVTSNG